MAETKTEYLDSKIEVSPDDVELNAALAAAANSQTLEAGLAEMISLWSESVR